jgi:hypothetical protein
MQHTPLSANTNAPASNAHSPLSFAAVTVSPALVLPIPVVNTVRGAINVAYFKN